MRKSMKLALAIMSLMLAGCGGGMMPLKSDVAQTLRNRQVTLFRVPPASSFSALAFDPNPLTGGALIANAIAGSKGKSLIAKNKIEDPAIALASNLSKELTARYRTKTTSQAKAEDLGDITKKNFPKADLALYVRTNSWRLAYFISDFASHYVEYRAEFALIDVKQDMVLAKGSCKSSPDDPENGLEYDDLVRNNASLLKRELQNAVGFCANLLKYELFPK
jgi:hypothetical protein